MQTAHLTSDRLEVRPFATDDARPLFEAGQDAEVQRWTGIPIPFTLERAREFVTTVYPQGWADDFAYTFGSFRRDNGAFVSNITVFGGRFAVYEIGFWTAPGQRGQGLTSEGVRCALEWSVDALHAERLEWQGIVGNDASWTVARRLGFQFEGSTRSRIVQRGIRRDTHLAGLLATDLIARRGLPIEHHPAAQADSDQE